MILLGLAFSLVACDRADSRRYEADMPMKSVPQGDQCPDLAGTYAFEPRSAAERFLVPTRFGNQHFSLLRIESWSDSGYRFTVKASREAFDAAVAELAAHDPKRHREWQELLDERERVIKANKLPRVSDESIAALGPLPEMARNVSRQACAEYWVRSDDMLDQRAYADVGDPVPDAAYDLELWFARDAQGDLIYRIDRYRMHDFLFGGKIRTTRSRHFQHLEAVDHDRFDWEPERVEEPEPVEVVSREALPRLVAGVSQVLMSALPAGGEITRFTPREVDASGAGAEPSLIIDVSGLAPSNADVSNLLRAVDAAEGVHAIELVSLRATEQGRIEFRMTVSVQARH